MNAVDLFLLLILVIAGTAWGFWKGALRQVLDALAFGGGLLITWVFAGSVAKSFGGSLKASFPVTLLFVSVVLFALAYVVIKVIWSIPIRLLEKKGDDGAAVMGMGNRAAGGVLGTLRMGLVLWTVLSLISLVQGKVAQAKAELLKKVPVEVAKEQKAAPAAPAPAPAPDEHSAIYAFVTDHNLIDLIFRERLQQVQQLAADLAGGKKRAVEGFDTLAKDERLHAIAQDAALRKALETGDLGAVAKNPAVLSLVSDREVMERIAAALQGAVVQAGAASGDAKKTADELKKTAADAAKNLEETAAKAAEALKGAAEQAPAAADEAKKAVEGVVPATP